MDKGLLLVIMCVLFFGGVGVIAIPRFNNRNPLGGLVIMVLASIVSLMEMENDPVIFNLMFVSWSLSLAFLVLAPQKQVFKAQQPPQLPLPIVVSPKLKTSSLYGVKPYFKRDYSSDFPERKRHPCINVMELRRRGIRRCALSSSECHYKENGLSEKGHKCNFFEKIEESNSQNAPF